MEQGMLNLGTQVTAGAGGLRDMYLAYLEQSQNSGVQPLPFQAFVKALEQQKKMQQQMQPPPGMMPSMMPGMMK